MTCLRNPLYLGRRELRRTSLLRPIVESREGVSSGREARSLRSLLKRWAGPAELTLGAAMYLVQEGCEGKQAAIEARIENAISAYLRFEFELRLAADAETSPLEWGGEEWVSYSLLTHDHANSYVARWVIGATAAQILKDQVREVAVPRSAAGDESLLGLTEMARYLYRGSCARTEGAVINSMRDRQYDRVLEALRVAREHAPLI